MPNIAPLSPGDPRSLGGMDLLGRLGEGGQGVVYLATDPSGTRVAIKWLRSDQAADQVSIGRFLREVEVAQQVAPFCTAAVLGTGVELGRPYIVSEFIDGPSLHQVVQQDGPRTGTTLHRLAIGTATALAAIHQAGIVHRDFKPANVIIGADGPRVIDFGIARALDATSTLSSMPVGTPSYMPPEQVMGHQVGPAADLFSWGGTMVYAASGNAPFGSDTMPAVINRVLNRPPELTGLDGTLLEVVAACLDKDPARRPTAEQVIIRLLQRPVPRSGILAQGSAAAIPAESRPAHSAPNPAASWPAHSAPNPAASRPVHSAPNPAASWPAPAAYPAQPPMAAHAGQPRPAPAAKGRTLLVMGAAVGCALLLLAGVMTVNHLNRTTVAAPRTSPTPTTPTPTPTTPAPAPASTVPAKGTPLRVPGGSITIYEHESDPITLTSYEVYDEKGKEWVDYARRNLTGAFVKYPRNKESLVSPDGRYLATRGKNYSADDFDFIEITDRRSGGEVTIETVRSPLQSTIRSWSKDGSKILLNIEEKTGDEWYYVGFGIVDVATSEPEIVMVRDKQVQETAFGWDSEENGVVNVYGGKNQGLRFYAPTGKVVREAPGIGTLASGTMDMFSPSGRTFVTDCPGGGDGDHCLWNSATGKRVRAFTSPCDKVLGWYDETHLYCWEQDDASRDEVQVVDFKGKLVRKLIDIGDDVDYSPIYTLDVPSGS
ncbi:serine/threonine protein kinase [Nonomuraea glycinis]|nr:serine/threonine-protein kinase [Nonomuraea glycinis]MCA2179908.1 serine/threonine protein kinase [Nonomuraea glycinis]